MGCIVEGFEPSRKTLELDAVPSVFFYKPPKTIEARIAQAKDRSIINDLLSPEPCNQKPELKPLTKEVGMQCN